jgi:5-methylcytosine-specific restriction endonuclease McrA
MGEAAQRAGQGLRGPGIGRDLLESLAAQGLSIRQIAAELGRSYSSVRYWLTAYEIKTVRSRKARVELARAARRSGRSRFIADCAHHGRTEFIVFAGDRSRCARCNVEAVTARRRRVKRILVEEAGGACAICGYDRVIGALQFHHLEPASKSYGVGAQGVARSLEKARTEASKCVLLCANCHVEVEAGVARVP